MAHKTYTTDMIIRHFITLIWDIIIIIKKYFFAQYLSLPNVDVGFSVWSIFGLTHYLFGGSSILDLVISSTPDLWRQMFLIQETV